MGHFWTLCIEEQFYLIWPWLVFAIRDRKRLLWISISSAMICPALRMVAVNILPQSLVNSGVTCWFTPLRIDALLLGAIIALVRRGPHADNMLPLARAGFILLSLAVLGWFALNPAARSSLSDFCLSGCFSRTLWVVFQPFPAGLARSEAPRICV
jgi:peptidoglycan/LPS O-acetylase OafA/YrhL